MSALTFNQKLSITDWKRRNLKRYQEENQDDTTILRLVELDGLSDADLLARKRELDRACTERAGKVKLNKNSEKMVDTLVDDYFNAMMDNARDAIVDLADSYRDSLALSGPEAIEQEYKNLTEGD